MNISKLIEEVYLLNRFYVSDGIRTAVDKLAKHSTVKIKDHVFKSGQKFNGWQVPKKWEVEKAKLLKNGRLIYDGTKHPLGTITYSSSFEGKISFKELKKHIFVAHSIPTAIPFHFRMQYRPWDSEWGLCMPKLLADSLEKSDEYEVQLKTSFSNGEMIVREFILEGDSKESIIFVAHIDHAGQANDDTAGCAVGIALLEKIKEKYKNRKYTYRLILTQEIVGSVFYLNNLPKEEVSNIKFGMFLEMLGNDNTLNLQKSFKGDTYFDKISQLALYSMPGKNRECGFRESAGNDEIVFEAPGYNIPMPSISRWPYNEYHTNLDNMDIIHEDKLQESLEYLLKIVFILENDHFVKRKFQGLVSLANPKYDLYIDPGQVVNLTFGQNLDKASFQYKMPNYLEGNFKISDIAFKFSLDFKWLFEYFEKMKKKKLVDFIKS